VSQRGFVIDYTRCIGCKACTVSCKSENNTRKGVNYRRVIHRETGAYPSAIRRFLSMACSHCSNPACQAACPVGAITKRTADGVVFIDQTLCVGCRRCEAACPYGAPRYNAQTQKVEKCTLCEHRLAAGLEPACVTTCVGRALRYAADITAPITDPYTGAALTPTKDLEFLSPSDLTNPNTKYVAANS
jgi:DMSO reductase iron-sulfur subunit